MHIKQTKHLPIWLLHVDGERTQTTILASANFYGADYNTDNADYVKDPFSENWHDLFPSLDWTNVKQP